MKIAIVSVVPPYRGGIATHTAILAEKLSLNHDVKVFNFSRQYPNFLFPGKIQYEDDPKELSFLQERCIDSINPATWGRTAKKIVEFKPDLIIYRFWNPFFGLSMGGIAKIVSKLNPSIKQMALCDNVIPHESSMVDRYLTLKLFSKMDGFLVQSQQVFDELQKLCPQSKILKRLHPIYNNYGEKKDKDVARKELDISAKHVILYFGIVRGYKGFDTLIEAAALLKDKLNDFHIYAVGECYEDAQKYTNLIESLQVADVLTWDNNFVPDAQVSTIFSAADIMALPYRSASQSGIIQIANHFHIPVIATNVGGLPEYIDNGKTGKIVEANNPQELSTALAENFNKDLTKSYIENLDSWSQQFSWTHFIDGIEELYKTI